MELDVNGVKSQITFQTTSWNSWSPLSTSIELQAERNTIKLIASGDSGPNFDFLRLIGSNGNGPQWGQFRDADDLLIPGEQSIPTDSFFSVGIRIFGAGQEIDGATVTRQTVKLLNLSQGGRQETVVVNTTGGRDSVSLSPAAMTALSRYRIVIDGVRSGNGSPYQIAMIEFTTGSQTDGNAASFNFDRSTLLTGVRIANLVFHPDNSFMFASTLMGSVIRWNVQSDGSLSNRRDIVIGGDRVLIGIAIDPRNSNRIWISNNEAAGVTNGSVPGFFTSKISVIDVSDTASFSGSVRDYIVGLPRSRRDHLANSVVFGPDGGLYLSMGSNSAMGAPDNAWGNRPEALLSAAILRIDTELSAPTGGFDVSTDGANPYDPFAIGAPLTIYATGIRNTYDLLFHSNGALYAPNNGSGAGGNSPDDPRTSVDETITGGSTQQDLLFRIVQGGYYGHPNPSRGESIRDGGNPTGGGIPQVSNYPLGTQPETNYSGFVYDFGKSRPPNGVTEYPSNAFGGSLTGALLVVEYSGGDRVLGLRPGSNGAIIDEFVLATGFDNPLEVAVHGPTGNVYVATLGNSALTLLKAA